MVLLNFVYLSLYKQGHTFLFLCEVLNNKACLPKYSPCDLYISTSILFLAVLPRDGQSVYSSCILDVLDNLVNDGRLCLGFIFT